jgi:uncharacterized membrane protein
MGVLAALGYGLATMLGRLVRHFRHRPDWRAHTATRRIVGSGCVLLVGVAVIAGRDWQAELAGATGVAAPPWWWGPLSVVVGITVLFALVAIGRGARWLIGRLAAGLRRISSPRVATASALTIGLLVFVVAADRLPEVVVSVLNPLFRAQNAAMPSDVRPPTSPVVSGGPASDIAWSALGSQGRAFVSSVTPSEEISRFSGRAARDPIRVFVGVDSATSPQDRAELAVAELERFGAFDRSVIAVGTSAGSGTVDPGEVAPLEFLLNGDVATVSTQYSILPSFLSFVVDRPNSVAESRALITAVRTRAAGRSPERRPSVVVFGESLGAYGSSGAFCDLPDLLRTTDGAMFQGPPNASVLWRRYTDAREAGSPEHLPVYGQGRHLRWANRPPDLGSPPTAFTAPRVVFLQNASDPVVWWSPQSLWWRPDWLAEPRGPGVLEWPWLPLVTFAGLTGDLMNSQGVPAGHGHVYGTDPVYAWSDILRPEGWTRADTLRLANTLGG